MTSFKYPSEYTYYTNRYYPRNPNPALTQMRGQNIIIKLV